LNKLTYLLTYHRGVGPSERNLSKVVMFERVSKTSLSGSESAGGGSHYIADERAVALSPVHTSNNVEATLSNAATFDIVERTKFYNRIVRHCCRLWQQSRMLLQQSRTLLRQCCLLLRHCCCCGRGLRVAPTFTTLEVGKPHTDKTCR